MRQEDTKQKLPKKKRRKPVGEELGRNRSDSVRYSPPRSTSVSLERQNTNFIFSLSVFLPPHEP